MGLRGRSTSCLLVAFVYGGWWNLAQAQVGVERRDELLRPAVFLQIPGPNPILSAGQPGAWDDAFIEAADCVEDLGKYYLYYHGHSRNKEGYQLGVASASHPLGPFVKHRDATLRG